MTWKTGWIVKWIGGGEKWVGSDGGGVGRELEWGGGEEWGGGKLRPGKREPDSSLSCDCEWGWADLSPGRLLSFSYVPCQTEVWPAFRLLL